MEAWDHAGDDQLVAAIATGDTAALGEAFRRHSGPCFGMARRILGDRTNAEDVVQETFLRLWVRPDRYEPGRGALRGYLVMVSCARALDLQRAELARRRRETTEHASASQDAPDAAAEGEAALSAADVRRALELLPPPQRDAVHLVHLVGFSHGEAAAALHIPLGTVKSRVRVGLLRLSGILQQPGDG